METLLVPAAPTVTLTDRGQAQFRFPYDEARIAALKLAIEGVTWNGTLRAWTIRARPTNIRAIVGFAQEHGFAGVDQARVTQDRIFAAVRAAIGASKAPDADFVPPATLRGVLRPFQRAGVAYGVKAKRTLLADDMGLGKTVEAIAILESLNAFPAVIVCPASLKLNWQRELAAWLPHRQVSIEDGPECSATAGRPDVVIVNYDLLSAPCVIEALRSLKLKGVVFDEGHLLKEAKTQRSVAARALRRRVPVRILITGTPILNSPSELLNPLTILNRLEDLGGFWHFVERYCGGQEVTRTVQGGEKRKGWDITGASNLPELAGRLRATCMVRRRKRDVLQELPPRHLAMLPIEIDHRAEYDLAQRDVLAWIARRAGRDPAFRASIAGLDDDARIAAILARAQAAVDRAAAAEELVKIGSLRQIAARGKLAQAEEWIGNFMATGEKLVVFAWHREILTALGKKFAAPIIDGDTPLARRQAIVDDFQASPCGLRPDEPESTPCRDVAERSRALFVNLQAGGLGLTLTAASNVLVLEFPWTRALLDQAIDRVHRIGQLLPVTAWLMMGRRTIDYPIWKLLEKKRTIAEAATA